MAKKSISAMRMADALEWRCDEGFYRERNLPAERELAVDFGVSRTTVRRAIAMLLERERLERQENGRLRFVGGPAHKPTLALLLPAIGSSSLGVWYQILIDFSFEMDFNLRTYHYCGWNDPILKEVFELNQGIFLISRPHMPEWMKRKLLYHELPLVSLDYDLTGLQLPSFNPFPASAINTLLEYCRGRGFERLDMVCMTYINEVVAERIHLWHCWLNDHQCQGELIDFHRERIPPPPVLREKIRDFFRHAGDLTRRVFIFVTLESLELFLRAAADLGLAAGRDYFVAVLNGEGRTEYMVPAVTSLERVDLKPYIRRYLEWMLSGAKWSGPLLTEAAQATLHLGETVPESPPAPCRSGGRKNKKA